MKNIFNRMNKPDDNLKRIVSLMEADKSVDAPADAVKWSRNIFRTRRARESASPVKRLKAVLKIDLTPGQAAFGERSSGTGRARQMLFEAGSNSIDLRVTGTASGFEIRGQLLGEGFEHSSVHLGSFETEAGELAEFKFADVSAGRYDLVVKTKDQEILIEEIEIS